MIRIIAIVTRHRALPVLKIPVIKMEATRTLSELRSEHRDIRLNFKVFAISNVDIPLKS